jgi:hypothetical protein
MRWLKRLTRKGVQLVQAHWQTVLDWYLEREKLKQIKRREELGDL